jgi:arylsulfatase I/J
MWDNTLMILTADNGGFVKDPLGTCNVTDASSPGAGPSSDIGHGTACANGEAGANNWPLRGGKYSNWEGGIRANAFMSGGFLPKGVRGTRQDGVMHIADWYRTLGEGIAGVDPTDHWAAESGLPPVDSLNMWPMLSGETALSPRDESGFMVTRDLFMKGPWKYVTGGSNMISNARGGPQYPNETTVTDPIGAYDGLHEFKCPAQGCLYNVVEDLFEEHEVSEQFPDIVQNLKAELSKQVATVWETSHKKDNACDVAAHSLYGGYYGPWKEVGDWQSSVSLV